MEHLVTWLQGVLGIALAAIGIRQEILLRMVRRTHEVSIKEVCDIVEEIRTMHRHPNDYGFGSGETNRLLKMIIEEEQRSHKSTNRMCDAVLTQTRVVNSLIHYIRQEYERREGVPPHPPPPGESNSS